MLKLTNMQSGKNSKKKIKIGYVITKGVWGGAQKYVYTLATSLPKDKYDVFVICGEGGILKTKLEEKGLRVYELSDLKRDISIVAEAKSSWKLLRIIWKEKPDVLHLNSPKAAGFGAVAGRLVFTKKIIQTVHGFTFNEDRNIFARALISFFSWLTLLICHINIVIAKKEKSQALKMPLISKERIVLIRNGVEKIKFISKSIVREALWARVSGEKTPVKTVWLGTIAELHKNKGLEYAIRAVAEIKTPLVFFIIGGGEERPNLEKLIREKDLGGKVFLVGFVDNANLYLKAFDIFILPSLKEGLPYTILEAGLAGLPVITTSVGGIPDIIDDGVNGLLANPGSIKEISTGLEYLISNPEKRDIMGKKLKEKVEKEFSVDEMAEKTKRLYRT